MLALSGLCLPFIGNIKPQILFPRNSVTIATIEHRPPCDTKAKVLIFNSFFPICSLAPSLYSSFSLSKLLYSLFINAFLKLSIRQF